MGYFDRYTSLVKEDNLIQALENQMQTLQDFYASISEEKSMYAYAMEKWTIKEMLQHMIDTERIFTYRALCIARKETTTLPGFEENDYAANSNANIRNWQSLQAEMNAVRQSTILMYKSFSIDMLEHVGTFSSTSGNASTLGFICVGHVLHHIALVRERYF
jgi:uncharacterized damage-inducible protein DinB